MTRRVYSDGYVVRLANFKEKHFPTATLVRATLDGGIELWFDLRFLASFSPGEYLSYWPVYRETLIYSSAKPGRRIHQR